MGAKSREIMEELRSVVSGKTLDALFPPFVYVLANNIFGLGVGAALAIGTALAFSAVRLLKKQNFKYALGGLGGVLFASGFAFWAGSAENYFLPRVFTSAALLLLTVGSLILRRPVAAYASHITRGWPLEWFWRKDVKPAYVEVTWFWASMILLRMVLQIMLLARGSLAQIVWINTLLGFPFTGGVLILTYVYGLWRLRNLKGPGVEEFRAGKEPPWKGQTRGF